MRGARQPGVNRVGHSPRRGIQRRNFHSGMRESATGPPGLRTIRPHQNPPGEPRPYLGLHFAQARHLRNHPGCRRAGPERGGIGGGTTRVGGIAESEHGRGLEGGTHEEYRGHAPEERAGGRRRRRRGGCRRGAEQNVQGVGFHQGRWRQRLWRRGRRGTHRRKRRPTNRPRAGPNLPHLPLRLPHHDQQKMPPPHLLLACHAPRLRGGARPRLPLPHGSFRNPNSCIGVAKVDPRCVFGNEEFESRAEQDGGCEFEEQ
mmetsp:Transcript_29611/g.54624  ORF Transcript_29611/g.54624 Transcript_29611/m.54624 type:complete len:259 (+) Transcript_29611:280-1056(+)